MAEISEDLPALGKPTSPTSATVFSSRMRSRCSPGSPLSANPGALRRGLARAALPRPPPPPAGRRDEPGADPDQVGENLTVRGLDLGPVRHRDDQVGGVGAGPVRALSLPAVAGPSNRPAVEVEQGGRAGLYLEDHVTAAAAVAARRAAQRPVLL